MLLLRVDCDRLMIIMMIVFNLEIVKLLAEFLFYDKLYKAKFIPIKKKILLTILLICIKTIGKLYLFEMYVSSFS